MGHRSSARVVERPPLLRDEKCQAPNYTTFGTFGGDQTPFPTVRFRSGKQPSFFLHLREAESWSSYPPYSRFCSLAVPASLVHHVCRYRLGRSTDRHTCVVRVDQLIPVAGRNWTTAMSQANHLSKLERTQNKQQQEQLLPYQVVRNLGHEHKQFRNFSAQQ